MQPPPQKKKKKKGGRKEVTFNFAQFISKDRSAVENRLTYTLNPENFFFFWGGGRGGLQSSAWPLGLQNLTDIPPSGNGFFIIVCTQKHLCVRNLVVLCYIAAWVFHSSIIDGIVVSNAVCQNVCIDCKGILPHVYLHIYIYRERDIDIDVCVCVHVNACVCVCMCAVSYTHLTLPTRRTV